MPNKELARKSRRFRSALVLAGTTAEAWANEQGVTAGHLSQVLSGKRESAALMAKVEAFTEKHLAKAAA